MAMEGLRFLESWINTSLGSRVVTVTFLILIVLTRRIVKTIILGNEKDIPEPPGLPLIGHLHLFGRLSHQILMKLALQYGPLMSVRLGVRRILVVSNVELAKEVLKPQDAVWASRPPSVLGEIFSYNNKSVAAQPPNDLWRDMRKVYTSELLSPTNIEKQKDQRHESVMRMVNSLLASQEDNQPVDIIVKLADMFCYHMTKLLFGNKSSVEDDYKSTSEKKTLPQLVRELACIEYSLSELFPYLRWLDIDKVESKMKKIHGEFDNYFDKQLETRHRQLLEANDYVDNSRDFLQALLSFLDSKDGTGRNISHLKAALKDMITGGIDTSASTTSSAIAEIMRHPEIKEKLVKELDDVVGRERLVEESDLVNLKYLKLVIKETMRLHPAATLLIPHMSVAPSVLAGYHIPANTSLIINVYAIQRDPELWDEPLAFKPERFLDSSIDVRGQHFQLLPFGSGRRMCPGMNMALASLEIVLARLFHSLDIQLPPGIKPGDVDMTEKSGSVTTLANPIKIVVKPRLPEKLYRQKP